MNDATDSFSCACGAHWTNDRDGVDVCAQCGAVVEPDPCAQCGAWGICESCGRNAGY